MTPDTLVSAEVKTAARVEQKSRLGFYIIAGIIIVASIACTGALVTLRVHQGVFAWQAYAALVPIFSFIFFVDWLLLRRRQD